MKQIIQLLSVIIIIILVGYFSREFFPKVNTIETIRIDTVWRYKTITKDSIITKLVPKYVYLPGDTIYIPENCDSLRLFYLSLYKQHYSINGYNETFPIDTIGYAKITISTRANMVDTLGFSYDIKIFEKEVKIIERVVSNDWYIYGETDFNSLSLGTIYARKDFVYKATYNINNKSAQVGVGIKLNRLWK